jgi:hypothetical protein
MISEKETTFEMASNNGFFIEGTGGGCEALVRDFGTFSVILTLDLTVPKDPYKEGFEPIEIGVFKNVEGEGWIDETLIYRTTTKTLDEFFNNN